MPYASAMCELDRRALDDREQGSAHVEMLNRIMAVGGLDPARVDRVQVVFDGAKADDPLGRNAHLYFVQNERFLMQLAMCVDWFL